MLRVDNLSAGVLKPISLRVPAGSVAAICGPSGSGKTTLLKAIAGMISSRGAVEIDGRSVARLPPWRRPCRYLDQQLWLFPWLTLDGHLRLAQYAAGQPLCPLARRQVLVQMEIEHLRDRYPGQISGGERQRAALARALISRPPLLLLDEPFASLDWATRTRLWRVIRELRGGATALVLVTHEPRDAWALAEQCWHLHQGRLLPDCRQTRHY
ncbi:ATP-binding cassette domain-containing protein [Jejubacter calystegiae]|uniref:ATP-binding cassette domain-containing protein n=1 Tax=Jejubacter calystegiae TaxID=2579935 RepID=A0A4V1G7G8_9ENTR|nr:ATP-binding cassette domain-containing protein [Jejubacter calystegiae]QCT19597.1 ATP-binding cassette domain-containing protein [Jejubacter calystegiae]